MAHVVSSKLRKAPFIKQGVGPDGQSTMYVVELSESIKDYKTQERTYSNYKAMFFAKTPGAVEYYNKAFAEGSFVVVSAEKIKVEQRDYEGKVYVTLMLDNPRLEGAQFDENAQGWGQPQQPQQQAPQQQQQYSAPQGQPHPQQQPPANFDNDIPF